MATQATTTLKLDAKTKQRLKKLGTARRRSAHWLMIEAVRQYLEREEAREQLHQDALAAWREYEETGLHLTGEEMDAWLTAVAGGRDVSPPKPHR